MSEEKQVLLSLKGLSKHFTIKQGFFKGKSSTLKAVDNISLDIVEKRIKDIFGTSLNN